MAARNINRLLLSAGYFAAVALVSTAVLELVARHRLAVPLLATGDLRGSLTMVLDSSDAAVYDPHLGWSQKPHFRSAGFNTIDYGIRSNGPEPRAIEQGAILAVGDSFTAGSDVTDADTWPAQVEKMMGRRVLNAGVGGYGVDQSALRAEMLIPILKPRAVIIGIYEADISRAAFSAYSAPKPYFYRSAGAWKLGNQPVPRTTSNKREPTIKVVLVHSGIAYILARRFAPDWWLSNGRTEFKGSGEAPARVSCHALRRLSRFLSQRRIPAFAVFEYGSQSYLRNAQSREVSAVIRCAREFEFTIIDPFRAIAGSAPDVIGSYFVRYSNGGMGHMSAAGNEVIATLIAAQLRQPQGGKLVARPR
jgi:hypothetical protein